ncbi:MAG: Crp/Fnr family transcriptional regulator [Fibrobacterota bacterium]
MPITTRTIPAGTVLFHENDRSRDLYIIQSGRLKVYRSDKGQRIDICELEKGGLVGEMSLLDGRSRSATVEAVEDSEVSVITLEEFEHKVHQIPDWFLGIIKILCARLRDVDRRLKGSLDDEISANVASLLSMLMNKNIPAPGEPFDTQSMDLKFAKQEMMDILSLTHDKVTAALKELEGHKLITVAKNRLNVPDRPALTLYARFKRGVEIDTEVDCPPDLSDAARAVLHLLFNTTQNAKVDKEGECELSLNDLGSEADKLFSGGDFLKVLAERSVVGLDDKSLLAKEPKDLGKIKVNRRKIASLLAASLFSHPQQ